MNQYMLRALFSCQVGGYLFIHNEDFSRVSLLTNYHTIVQWYTQTDHIILLITMKLSENVTDSK